MYRTAKTDLLIIGSGAAGLRTAIEAHDLGVRKLVVLGKCRRGDAHTVLATGGINAALGTMDPQDTWLIHAADTLRDGEFIADYREVMLLCKNAPRAINELVSWGARFHREKDGRLTQRFFGAHTYRRTCFFGDQTGKEIMRVLMAQVKTRRIAFLENIFIASLLKNGGRISGALGIDFKKGQVVVFNSKAVVLAAGGYTKVYSRSSSRSNENQGDGAGLALEAGVPLVDMEMIQFHPTGMVFPPKAVGTLVTEAVRGEGGILLNSKLERFMKRYDPKRLELGPRDEVARAIYTEIREGRGTGHDAVWLDITRMPKGKILERLPKMYEQFKKYDHIDISKQRMEVAPTAHYTMGGVDVSARGETELRGLYAVGETVGQIHGANRLGGNSLLETMVFGRVVGGQAAKLVRKTKLLDVDRNQIEVELKHIDGFFGKGGVEPMQIREGLQKAMWKYVGIARNETSLRNGLVAIHGLRNSFRGVRVRGSLKGNDELKTALETEKMFDVCECVIRSALQRKESRGAHYRTDYPKEDDKNWMANIITRKIEGKIELSTRPVPKLKGPLKSAVQKRIAVMPHKLLE